jgi:hypothetical protein
MDLSALETLAAKLEIQSVKALYCEGVDLLSDKEASRRILQSVFSEDVRADYGSGIYEGREAVVAFLVDEVCASREWLWHSIHTPFVAVEGDRGVGRWTIDVFMKARGSDEVQSAIGRYIDEFRRTPEGWRISHMRWVAEHSWTVITKAGVPARAA